MLLARTDGGFDIKSAIHGGLAMKACFSIITGSDGRRYFFVLVSQRKRVGTCRSRFLREVIRCRQISPGGVAGC